MSGLRAGVHSQLPSQPRASGSVRLQSVLSRNAGVGGNDDAPRRIHTITCDVDRDIRDIRDIRDAIR